MCLSIADLQLAIKRDAALKLKMAEEQPGKAAEQNASKFRRTVEHAKADGKTDARSRWRRAMKIPVHGARVRLIMQTDTSSREGSNNEHRTSKTDVLGALAFGDRAPQGGNDEGGKTSDLVMPMRGEGSCPSSCLEVHETMHGSMFDVEDVPEGLVMELTAGLPGIPTPRCLPGSRPTSQPGSRPTSRGT